jgi:xanthine dehydrogenase accessory factor
VSESAAILAEAEAAFARGETPVLATVVAIRGSSYRKPGARMLVSGGRWRAGSISGGCLETDIVRRSSSHEVGELRTYDTSRDGDVALGCGGEVDVFIETLPSTSRTVAALRRVVRERVPVEVPVGEVMQTLQPAPRLVVIGGGYDVTPVVSMSNALGWDVHVVDWKPSSRTDATFHLRSPQQLDRLPLEQGCAVVIMSHHLLYDEGALLAVLASPLPGYIGVLGPRRRTNELLARRPADLSLERLRAPVGLDLGGDGAPAVALSITAEIQLFFSKRV